MIQRLLMWCIPDNSAKKSEKITESAQCFTYIYSHDKRHEIKPEDYFNGNKNDEYKKRVSTESVRSDIEKCMLYPTLEKLMKALTSQHSPPPKDLYILRFNCSPEEVITAIRNDQFNLTIDSACAYLDLWRQQNIDPTYRVNTYPNPHIREHACKPF